MTARGSKRRIGRAPRFPATGNRPVVAMSLMCGLVLATSVYLRLSDIGPPARIGLLVASLAMVAMMLRLVSRQEREP